MDWFRRLFGKIGPAPEVVFQGPTSPPLPECRTYVIGDIHGQKHLLDRLLGLVFEDSQGAKSTIVCVGDLIDRGEQSRDVLTHLQSLAARKEVVCLMGNHERMMLDFIDEPETYGRRWLRNGGLQTLASFGIGGCTESSGSDQLLAAAEHLAEKMGPELIQWIRDLPLTWHSGNLWVVHAAALPDVPMPQQTEKVLLWGSSRFHKSGRPDENWVVHGHTVVDHPTVHSGRVSVDTGAYFSGRLTAAVIDPAAPIRFLQT